VNQLWIGVQSITSDMMCLRRVELNDQSLVPGDGARIASTHFENWLGKSSRAA